MTPMTSGERLKIMSLHGQGLTEAEIAKRLNKNRENGHLKDKNLSNLTAENVVEWLGFFNGSQISA